MKQKQVLLYWSYDKGYRLYMTDTSDKLSDNDLVATIPTYRGGYAEQFASTVCKHIGNPYYWSINSDRGRIEKLYV